MYRLCIEKDLIPTKIKKLKKINVINPNLSNHTLNIGKIRS